MTVRITPLADPEQSAGSHRLAWLAADGDGMPLGSAYLRLFRGEGERHLGELELTVHPAERRRGVGSLLLAAAVEAARADGRRSVTTQTGAGTPGEHFLAARGLRKVLGMTWTRLELAAADVPPVPASPGYRLVSWAGTVPDELAASFAASRRAMDDMPMDDTDHTVQTWDVEKVRHVAEVVARRGDLLHTVAAVEEAGGAVVGFTELVVPGSGTGEGQHYGTGVLPEHRGHGLARWMKAETIRDARRRYPQLAALLADTADSNGPMRRVNEALGYLPTHRTAMYQLDL
ncbi:GNAT family N-acetyltransferase [Kitasatospora sp. McL0602]|uniref:GNAT family N-acetyltransferase n=1 Tax=Kitasatospora sp. McL0602 TaxID=3439530 RepID=UPI003F8BBD10